MDEYKGVFDAAIIASLGSKKRAITDRLVLPSIHRWTYLSSKHMVPGTIREQRFVSQHSKWLREIIFAAEMPNMYLLDMLPTHGII